MQEKQAHYYNKGAKDLVELKPGNVVWINPIGSDTKEPVKAVIQSKVGMPAYELQTENGRVYVCNHHHLRKSHEPFYSSFPAMSFKGVASPSKNDVTSSLNRKEQHVTGNPTIFPATSSEPKPATSPPGPDRRAEPQSPVEQTASESYPIQTTRSGRVVKPPAHFQDYV